MGRRNGDNVDTLKAEETRTSEPTVEIKIKTLDSQTYTLRVDKCVSVTTLKEQIATMTGIVSEQQRLIFRGRVLKDDQLLSAYHVEDGHTLHLVPREPILSPEESMDDTEDPDNSPTDTDTQIYPMVSGVVIQTFDILDQTQGGMDDLRQLVSAFMGSLPGPLNRNGSASDSNREPPVIGIHRTTTASVMTDSARRQPVLVSSRGHPASLGPSVAGRGNMYPPVIPDSLTTLSRYLYLMMAEFAIANGVEENSAFPGSPPFDDSFAAPELSQVAFRRGMPTPESLAEVLQSTRQLLNNQISITLNRLGTQLQSHVNVTAASARMSIQSNAMRSGINLRNIGALLLELGRTTMMLRMGETPADAVVNTGSAVFVNEYGPNSIMVQSFPMGSEVSDAGLRSSYTFFPSYADIRSRRGNGDGGERTGQRQSQEPVGLNTSGVQPTVSRMDAEVHTSEIENLRNMFNVVNEQQHPPQTVTSDTNDHPTLSAGASEMTPRTELAPSDEGVFLSNILHQIMPYISQISATGSVSGSGPSTIADNNGQQNMEHENSNRRSSLRRRSDEPSPPSETKRQKIFQPSHRYMTSDKLIFLDERAQDEEAGEAYEFVEEEVHAYEIVDEEESEEDEEEESRSSSEEFHVDDGADSDSEEGGNVTYRRLSFRERRVDSQARIERLQLRLELIQESKAYSELPEAVRMTPADPRPPDHLLADFRARDDILAAALDGANPGAGAGAGANNQGAGAGDNNQGAGAGDNNQGGAEN